MGGFFKKKNPDENKTKGKKSIVEEESEGGSMEVNDNACGAFLTRKVFKKSFDDTIWDALMVMEDLMENMKECADGPNFYMNEVFQDPCPKGPMKEKMKKQNEQKNDGHDDLPPHLRRRKT
ncbi:hypothetical protein WA026_015058 [Henosepilachna vigintioctopunctata]|uniref:Uncharacterized protein n=1 Tax=Henosepilachna vigintioctopunctata TaxID=420089 RepID=A0AAW1U2V0_9CUCU